MHGQSASNDSVDYERIGRFIYTFHRVCGSIDALNETALATNAPPELKDLASNLAQKFNHILKNAASTSEKELESTLNQASEVQAQISEWRSNGQQQ
jgi:hypothetical protein